MSIIDSTIKQYLEPNQYFDYEHPNVRSLTADILSGCEDDTKQQIIAMYRFVRDRYAYNPYLFQLAEEQFNASHCAIQKESYCIPKAVLFGAVQNTYPHLDFNPDSSPLNSNHSLEQDLA